MVDYDPNVNTSRDDTFRGTYFLKVNEKKIENLNF